MSMKCSVSNVVPTAQKPSTLFISHNPSLVFIFCLRPLKLLRNANFTLVNLVLHGEVALPASRMSPSLKMPIPKYVPEVTLKM